MAHCTSLEKILIKTEKTKIRKGFKEVNRNIGLINYALNFILQRMERRCRFIIGMRHRPHYARKIKWNDTLYRFPDVYEIAVELRLPPKLQPRLNVFDEKSAEYRIFLTKFSNEDLEKEGFDGRVLRSLVDENFYIRPNAVNSWFRDVIYDSLKKFQDAEIDNKFSIRVHQYDISIILLEKQPTLKITFEKENITVNVKLVPHLPFKLSEWEQLHALPVEKKYPLYHLKPIYLSPTRAESGNKSVFWEPSFNTLFDGMFKKILNNEKVCLKFLMYLRDVLDHQIIEDYHLKSVFMLYWAEDRENGSMSATFLRLLKYYEELLKESNIPFFWNGQVNLLKNVDKEKVEKIYEKIKEINEELEFCIRTPGKRAGNVIRKYFFAKTE